MEPRPLQLADDLSLPSRRRRSREQSFVPYCLAAALLATLTAALGCTQSTHLLTDPAGAKVYVNGELLGVSPVELIVEDGPGVAFPTRLHARFERAGYEPLEKDLPTQISGGRVAAGIFTLGISFALQSTRTVRPSYLVRLYPIVTGESQITNAWAQDLRRLQRLKDDGLISQEEFDRRRAILLRSTPHDTGERPTY